MLRAVIDPGVLIAAALSLRGAPAELLRRWLAGDYELVVSDQLLAELGRVPSSASIFQRWRRLSTSIFSTAPRALLAIRQ